MKYQIYAFDCEGTLNHAGSAEATGATVEEARRIEHEWRKWRRQYLKDNPGDYPLRRHHRRTVQYAMNPVGQPDTVVSVAL